MEKWENVLKLLADDTRRSIVGLLLVHDYCVGALARRTCVSEAAVSQHLRALREAGVVTGEKRGYYTHYTVSRELLNHTARQLMDFIAQEPDLSGKCPHQHGRHTCSRPENRTGCGIKPEPADK